MKITYDALQRLIKIAKAAEEMGGIISTTDIITKEYISDVLHEIEDQNQVTVN